MISSRRSPPPSRTRVGPDDASLYVVAYDFGIKRSILDQLVGAGCQVEVVPASMPAADVLAREPDGVFLSNGPGDPAAVRYAQRQHRRAARQAAGVRHLPRPPDHGARARRVDVQAAVRSPRRQPPRAQPRATGRVEITSQNHNYAVDAESLPDGAEVTHLNLNDGDVEGMRAEHRRAFSVQYHPEAGPGPHDARYLFAEFTELMRAG